MSISRCLPRWTPWVRVAALACLAPGALAMTPEQALSVWSHCDDTFFRPEVIRALNPGNQLPTAGKDGQQWFVASNGHAEGDAWLDYATPLTIAGLPVRYYMTMNYDLGRQGLVYFWGFEFAGTLADVTTRLKPLLYRADQLVAGEQEYARTEVKFAPIDWTFFPTPFGEPAGDQHSERSLSIAPNEMRGTISVICSLQGRLPSDWLATQRPDLLPAQYPHPLTPAQADSTPLPPATVQAVAQWARQMPSWRPKFRRISLTFMHGGDIRTQTIRADGPLLQILEEQQLTPAAEPDPQTSTRSQSLAGLIELKAYAGFGKGAQSVTLLDQLQLQWPDKPSADSPLHWQGQRRRAPDLDGTVNTVDNRCHLAGSIPAAQISKRLRGRATKLVCKNADGDQTTYAGLPTLGVFLPLATQAPQGEVQDYFYVDFKVSR